MVCSIINILFPLVVFKLSYLSFSRTHRSLCDWTERFVSVILGFDGCSPQRRLGVRRYISRPFDRSIYSAGWLHILSRHSLFEMKEGGRMPSP